MPGRMPHAAELNDLVAGLAASGFDDKEKAITALAATGDAKAVPVLQAMSDGKLVTTKSDSKVAIAEDTPEGYRLHDPLTGAEIGVVAKSAVEPIRINNRLRRTLTGALGGLTLLSPDRGVRMQAAQTMFKSTDPEALALLDAALAKETDASVRTAMEQARAVIVVGTERPDAEKLAAIEILKQRGDRDALSILTGLTNAPSADVAGAATKAVVSVEQTLAVWSGLQNVWYGISLGSVLLLAAIGLAITFGVMGVINMAHGEMVMIGAYTTFMVQEIMRSYMPGFVDGALLIAIPLAFLIAGAVGIVIERSVIRWLYGRPLETLLATWGLSLILQQAVRSIFGPTNREVINPSYMSGGFEIGQLALTYNRMWIVVFSLVVLAALMLVLRKTSLGLHMRAVTQNRRMAGAMGIRTSRIDALTFGIGSGIAGIAGVALSQIDNVSPNLGQSYIIDSFMVVVFGGVGNLWGTLVGALTLGVVNKFLEPYAGAVLGKILVLVFIILFIQRRPRGLFALKGRAVEA
ncbi:MAG: urea ABC transporter permease subunit UrtB [Alphaproteobacteria bacterium]